jgi:hypothetical protein
VRVDALYSPRDDDELWDLDDQALRLKAYMTGDVFVDVADGDDQPIALMIVGHPCVIRGSRGRLASRIPCCVVKQMEDELPHGQWPEGRFHVFPVHPDLGLGPRHAAYLLEWRSVRRAELSRDRRRGTMTDLGVYALQQRFTHAITRCAPVIADFEKGTVREMREAELEYEWVDDLVGDPGDDAAAVNAEVQAFHSFLDESGHRALLREPGGESRLRAIVRAEIKSRRGAT